MEAEKEETIIGVRRYLIFLDHVIYLAVHRIMVTIFVVPRYAELYTIVGRPNIFSYSELSQPQKFLILVTYLVKEDMDQFTRLVCVVYIWIW